MSIALNLYRLQQVDSRLDQINTRLTAIHATLENNAELKNARQQLEQADKTLKQAEKALKQAELEASSQQIKIEQVESSLYSGRIHNPKELQELQNDNSSLKKHLATLEDSQLEAMLALETARADFETAQKDFDHTQGTVISQNASLKTEQESLQKEAERLTPQRLAILSAIDAASLALYDSLRQQRRGIAVATLSDSACDLCGASLTPRQAQLVHISQELIRCPSCSRILYAA